MSLTPARDTWWQTLAWIAGTVVILIPLAISLFAPSHVRAQLMALSAFVDPMMALICWVAGVAPLVILCLICADLRPCLFEAMKLLVACALAIGGVWSIGSEIVIGCVMSGLALYLAADAILVLRELDRTAAGESRLFIAAAVVTALEIAAFTVVDVSTVRAAYLLSAMPLGWLPFVGLVLYHRQAARGSDPS